MDVFEDAAEQVRARDYFVRGEELNNLYVKAVRAFHKVGVGGNFYERAFRGFYVPSGFVYFSFKEALASLGPGVSEEEVRGFLWGRMKAELVARRSRRTRGAPSCSSWAVEFPRWCASFAGIEDPDYGWLLRVYKGYLAYTLEGVVCEWRTFRRLSGVAPVSFPVRWGSDEDEHRDVDLWVGEFPVSVKNLDAFNWGTISGYRFGQGKDEPVVYVDEGLRFFSAFGLEGEPDELFPYLEGLREVGE